MKDKTDIPHMRYRQDRIHYSDTKKTEVGNQVGIGVDFDISIQILNINPFIMAIPTIKGYDSIPIPVRSLV